MIRTMPPIIRIVLRVVLIEKVLLYKPNSNFPNSLKVSQITSTAILAYKLSFNMPY
jgi:hypothetical protein